MGDIIRRMVWFAIVATAFSYAVFIVLGNFVTAEAQDEGPVRIRDVLEPGSHHLSGMVSVPQACDELLVRTEKLSTSSYELIFSTWQDPSVQCSPQSQPREFQAALFAPSTGVQFIATLNGRPLPVLVIPDITTASS